MGSAVPATARSVESGAPRSVSAERGQPGGVVEQRHVVGRRRVVGDRGLVVGHNRLVGHRGLVARRERREVAMATAAQELSPPAMEATVAHSERAQLLWGLLGALAALTFAIWMLFFPSLVPDYFAWDVHPRYAQAFIA